MFFFIPHQILARVAQVEAQRRAAEAAAAAQAEVEAFQRANQQSTAIEAEARWIEDGPALPRPEE